MSDNLQYYKDFCVPLDISRLRNDRMKLVPFESDFDAHSEVYFRQVATAPGIARYLPYGPWASEDDFKLWYDGGVRARQGVFWFAIILRQCTIQRKTVTNDGNGVELVEVDEGTMAGVTGLCNADLDNSMIEIGHVLTFPAFQGTFVTTIAHGLLLQHLLNPSPDLHFRRIQWQANAQNEPSRRTALRFGFTFEGITRWQRTLIRGKESEYGSDKTTLREPMRSALPTQAPDGKILAGGRHSAMFSLCWDDWLDGGKEKIELLMSTYK